jgi:PKD repeat protein
LGGAWSGFRDNNLRELMVRVNIGGYPCAITSGFNYTSNLTTINFSNQSTGGTSYLWDFGDGQTSTTLSPSHTYAAFGTYNVCLISTNSCGSDTSCSSVTVTCPSPAASFTTIPTGFSVQFNDGSGQGPTAWAWDFGDGGTSTLQNPTHLYAAPGTYNVCLITSNICGSDTVCNPVTVCAQPVSSFTFTTSTPGRAPTMPASSPSMLATATPSAS